MKKYNIRSHQLSVHRPKVANHWFVVDRELESEYIIFFRLLSPIFTRKMEIHRLHSLFLVVFMGGAYTISILFHTLK
jgi:hypothetical protein